MVKSSNANISNIHGGAHPHVFHSLEGLDTIRRILILVGRITHKINLNFSLNGILTNITIKPLRSSVNTTPKGLSYQQICDKILLKKRNSSLFAVGVFMDKSNRSSTGVVLVLKCFVPSQGNWRTTGN